MSRWWLTLFCCQMTGPVAIFCMNCNWNARPEALVDKKVLPQCYETAVETASYTSSVSPQTDIYMSGMSVLKTYSRTSYLRHTKVHRQTYTRTYGAGLSRTKLCKISVWYWLDDSFNICTEFKWKVSIICVKWTSKLRLRAGKLWRPSQNFSCKLSSFYFIKFPSF